MLPTEKTKKLYDISKMNTLIYGNPKVGKSTLASQIPDSLFLATEKGYNSLEVYKVDIISWGDLLKTCKELTTTEHKFTNLVIDTVDLLYRKCEDHIMKREGATHPSDLAFGKGFSMVKNEFVRVVNNINQAGYGITFISHSKEVEITKGVSKFNYMDTSLSGSVNVVVCGLCDFIFYAYIGSDGDRKIRTKPTKNVNAGDRTGRLPELMPMDYKAITTALREMK